MLTAFLDADVLFPVRLRDTLLWVAHFEVYSPRWSDRVLREMTSAILARYPQIPAIELEQMVADMNSAFPEAGVDGCNTLERVMTNDPKDRHVLAAALVAQADVLVTNNVKDFPPSSIAPYDITVQTADAFLSQALAREPTVVRDALTRQAAIKRRPPMTVAEVIDRLERVVPVFVAQARAAWHLPE